MQRVSDNILLIAVVALFVVFGAKTWFSPRYAVSKEEKRALARCPRFHADKWVEFPAAFEAYASDRMAFRTDLVKGRNLLKYLVWGVSGSPSVAIGRSGWLYFLGDGSVPIARHEQPFSAAELEQWRKVLQQRTTWMAAHGIKYLFVVAPDKHSIYPEYLPDSIKPVRSESRLDQLTAYLRKYPDIAFANLAEPLRKHKNEGILYLRTDTHWNQIGSYIGYSALMGSLNAWFPMVAPIARTQIKFENSPYVTGDCVNLMGLYGCLQEMAPVLVRCGDLTFRPGEAFSIADRDPATLVKVDQSKKASGKKLKVLVLHDSFGEGLKPYLSQNFENITWRKQDDLSCDSDVVLAENPDVVIQEVVERHASQYTPYFMEDWRQWVFRAIRSVKAKDVYLTLLPSTPEINVVRLQRLSQLSRLNVKPISCREWNERGDKVVFDPNNALFSQWYLIKSGDQGFKFLDKESEKAYDALTKFVQNSGHYKRVESLKLLDGSVLSLYSLI